MIRLFDKVMVEVKWLLPFYFFTFLPFSLSAQRLTVANTTVNAGRTGYLQPITATFELKNKSRKKTVYRGCTPRLWMYCRRVSQGGGRRCEVYYQDDLRR